MRLNRVAGPGDFVCVPAEVFEMDLRLFRRLCGGTGAVRAVFLDAHAVMEQRCGCDDVQRASFDSGNRVRIAPDAGDVRDVMSPV